MKRDTTKATLKATLNRQEKGAKQAERLYKLVDRNPKQAVYWYAKRLKWSYGKTQRAVERLEKEGLVRHTYDIKDGRMHKRVIPLEPEEIEVEL